MASSSGKFGINQYISSVKNLGIFDIDEDTQAKFEVINAASTNIFQVRGKIQGKDAFGLIGTIVGSQEVVFDISLFDFLEITCTTYASNSTYVEIIGSGFHLSSGGTSGGGDASAFNQSIQIGQLNNILAKQDVLLTELEQKTEPANTQNIRNLNSAQDSVTAVLSSAGGVSTAANQVTGNNSLQSIDTKMQGSMLANVQFDEIQVAYPSSTIERYAYYFSSTLSTTIEVTYADATKRVLTRVRKI
jgi:hypothetical protein